MITRAILQKVYKKREAWAHKGQFGKLALVVGSERHTGSPCFAGLAAARAGCDLVYVIAPERAAAVAAQFNPSLITEPLPGVALMPQHVPRVLETLEEVRATAVLIGPGLWRNYQTIQTIRTLIEKIDLPLVIDADAIRAVGRHIHLVRNRRVVLTPHSNEFLALTGGTKTPTGMKRRSMLVKRTANEFGVTIVLKGHVDVISNGTKIELNRTGSVYMTKGGCGDTLAGICGAYLARDVEPFTAGCAAAYVNGAAGDLAARELGESMLPTDLIEKIPRVIRR